MPARVVRILRQACASLKEAHEKSLVHRDIKPQNLMLCRLGGLHDVIKVLDFGLVKDTDGEQTRDLTKHLRILGTLLYRAPERVRAPSSADTRADLYSLAAVGFFLLTGQKLFDTDGDLDLLHQVLNSPARRPAEIVPGIPPALDQLIADCLAKNPDARPRSATDVLSVLDDLARALPWTEADAQAWWRANRAAG